MPAERRKSPRYQVRLRTYFPSFDEWGYTSDISLDGCYVVLDAPLAQGFISDFMLELPVIGTIALKGYVHHTSGKKQGAGFQFVQVRFAPDQSAYYDVYMQFIKLMPELEEIRDRYRELVDRGELEAKKLPEQENV
ncbi:MAG TPA: PilZ domain-containing protein [Thermodesulfobacteriaceae bacterium]|nr:PilZ domain-containing protein [Thermodesulfobacteriaceae bacterium]